MTSNSTEGLLVEYNDLKTGELKHGIALHSDQIDAVVKLKKILIRETDADFNLKKNDKGGDILTLKQKGLVRTVGFQD